MASKSNIKSAKESREKNLELGWDDIKVLSHTYDDWEVELFIPLDQVSEKILPLKLKQVKDLLSARYNIPQYALQYQNILQKEVTDDGVITHLRIKRISLEKGKPKFSFQSGISPSGILYSDMACYADLFLLDEFEKMLTPERIIMLLKSEGVAEEFIDKEVVGRAIQELQETSRPILGLRVAQGIFPDSGLDAEIEFYFHAQPSLENADEYISSRKVKRNDLLCAKNSPTEGKSPGKSVRGRDLPPRKGFDIILEPGKNARADIERTKLFAEIEGLAVVRREERSFMTSAGEKIIPSKVTARIDPLRIIEASENEIIDITTKESVEIRGNLKMGSRIISSGEVHIEGNVSENAVIHAADDLYVNGSINRGDLSSDKNIVSKGDVSGSRLSASGTVVIDGASIASTIIGRDVHIDNIRGGNITAGHSLTVNTLGADEDGISATICIATRDFLQNKINENNSFLDAAKSNLLRLNRLFSEDIVKEVIPQNVQQMLMKFISNQRKDGKPPSSQREIDAYKVLLNSIEPLRRLIFEKELENIRLQRQMRQSSLEKKSVVVKEKVTARTKVTIDHKTGVLSPQHGPVTISDQKFNPK